MLNYQSGLRAIQILVLSVFFVSFSHLSFSQEPVDATVEGGFPETAHATIEKVTTELLSELPALSASYDQSPEDFYKGIDRLVSPWIDYESFYKGVMGREYYTEATPEQRQRFKEVFQQSLVETYGKGLLGISETRFEIAPPVPVSGSSVPVQQTLYSGDGKVDVVYTMGQTETGRWQLKNVILEGINLGKTFRNQFARSARSYADDLDKVIENWSSEG